MERDSKVKSILLYCFTHPVQSVGELWICWVVGVPVAIALVWGAYSPSNFFGVLGISARRGLGGFVQETQPLGESVVDFQQGKPFELRPGGAPIDED